MKYSSLQKFQEAHRVPSGDYDPRKHPSQEAHRRWLRGYLLMRGGMARASEITDACVECGYSIKTLEAVTTYDIIYPDGYEGPAYWSLNKQKKDSWVGLAVKLVVDKDDEE